MALLYSRTPEKRKKLLYGTGVLAGVALVTVGIFASNGWFPHTDAFSGKRYGWFGQPLAKNAPSAWNPLPDPTPTPQLSKELIYAGQKLITIEDKNATAVPPADLAIWRPGSQGVWWIFNPATGWAWAQVNWGVSGDKPIPGDFDGDGTTDCAVRRDGSPYATWYIFYSASGPSSFQFGENNDIPAQADYDGDGKTDAAVYRPPSGGATYGIWYVQGTTAGFYSQEWGEAGDIPISADYDGDGRADFAVFRSSNRTFYSIQSSTGNIVNYASGISSGISWCDECAVSSDYDGDGKADYAVFDQAAANWYIKPSSAIMSHIGTPSSTTSGGFGIFQWGSASDKAVHNDYDADGKTDLAVWTNSGTYEGRWHIKDSADASTRNVYWGQAGDTPVPAFFRR